MLNKILSESESESVLNFLCHIYIYVYMCVCAYVCKQMKICYNPATKWKSRLDKVDKIYGVFCSNSADRHVVKW